MQYNIFENRGEMNYPPGNCKLCDDYTHDHFYIDGKLVAVCKSCQRIIAEYVIVNNNENTTV